MTTPTALTLPSLAKFMRDQAGYAQAPAGQPNVVADNYSEVAALLESFIDMESAITRKGQITEAVKQHNAAIGLTCAGRRADVRTPCGGVKAKHCADCPRAMGLTLSANNLAG